MTHIKRFDEHNLTEGMDIAVADIRSEAEGLVGEINDSLSHASAKLYDLQKMAESIKGEWPVLSKQISDIVEPMMIDLERKYPTGLKKLIGRFNQAGV